MTCAWKELIALLPQWMRQDVDRYGRERLQELRLRINAPPELVFGDESVWLKSVASGDDLQYCINAASRYSPWAAETASLGYLTATGGHRIGLCGDVVIHNGSVTGVRRLHSLCIRVARDYPGIGHGIRNRESMLILGAPGWGKTTLLRDISREIADRDVVAVVDERGEVFPEGIPRGKRMDVLTGCPKRMGIDRCLRTMGPQWIAVDEITAEEDCTAMQYAAYCGVKLLATAHASSKEDFLSRSIYQRLAEMGVFSCLIILNQRKQWRLERMNR